MTGKELIDYIYEHHAENMLVCAQYRDGGGLYNGGDDAMPLLGMATVRNTADEYNEYDIKYSVQEPNAIIL